MIDDETRSSAGGKTAHLGRLFQRRFADFPHEVRRGIGVALSVAQLGGKHPNAKPWKGEGPGILEIVEDHRGDAYRAVYTVRFARAVYVLHTFQKKSTHGIATSQRDKELITRRLKAAQKEYERLNGKDY